VAAGYLKSEFAALGAEFEERNDRADEALRAMKLAWTGSGVSFAGRGFEARGNTMLPRPVQKPHPPLWVGGNSRRAIRRAVELGDGWIPFPTQSHSAPHLRTAAMETIGDLEERLAYLREHVASVGRTTPLEIGFMPFGADMFSKEPLDPGKFLASLRELEALGISWVMLSVPCESRSEYRERVARFGKEIIRHP
jgi:alkanesulfonate monooxygenase SsuD/methylene tetrahydromethanopterin reductase-like flavin-dependent oxidoreductase (luciferase family)